MNGVILTPTKINALFLEEDRYVVPPAVDFSSLPWSDGFHDHNPDTPYLSLSVLNSSFASDTFRLKPGIHLHWLLPAAYRRAFLNSQNGMSHIYCPAPNIWLVRRFSDDGESKEWVVESDVLMPPAYFPHASGSYMPYDSKHGSPPFRMIGRTLALQKWLDEKKAPDRYPKLTAMGYGDAAFASYYPASSRCFGFHDPDIFDLKKSPTYEVIGWRKEKDDNLINWIVNNSISGKRFNTDELISKSFGWHLENPNPGNKSTIQSNPSDVVVCYSRIKITPGDNKPGKLTNHQVSLGSNANDALAAYLTKQTLNNVKSTLKKSQIEEQLDYLSAINAIANQQSDKYYKLLETRHEQSYVAESGGISWALRNEPNKETANAVNTGNRLAQEYPAELGKLLGKANELQKEYQTAQYSIIDLQTQIFFDWHRYQFAMYPQGTENRIHANVDEIKHFIQNVSIKKLNEMQRNTGEINYRFTENKTLINAKASTGTKASTAQTLATALNQLTKKLSIYNHCFISGKIHGDITLEQDSTIGGYLRFGDANTFLEMDHLEGLNGATFYEDKPLRDFSLVFWLKLNPGEGGIVVSFDPTQWFEIEVLRSGNSSGHLLFTTVNSLGEIDRMESNELVANGQWRSIVVTYNTSQSEQSIQIDQLDKQSKPTQSGLIGGRKTRSGYLGVSTFTAEFSDIQEVKGHFKGSFEK